MSYTHLDQSALDDRYKERAEHREVRDLFRAHTSPAFFRLVQLRTTGREPPSLANCKKVPTSETAVSIPSGDSGSAPSKSVFKDPPETAEDIGHVSAATEAIRMAISRDRDRQRKVIALIGADEVAHAKRLAMCGRRSVQLECPELAGGCGSKDNYVPVSCGSRLCADCMDRKMGRTVEQYRGVVASFDHPTMIRLSLPNRVEGDNLDRGKDALIGAFGRLRRRVVSPSGQHQGKRWVWSTDGGDPADYYWKAALMGAGERDLAKYWEVKYVNQGRGIPFEEIVRSGLYGVDLKQKDDGRFNVHMHVIADAPYIPQAALSSMWDDLVGAPVVDVRRIDGRDGSDTESALVEAVGYAAKAPEFTNAEAEVQYLTALKGSKLTQPFGELHGNTPQVSGLLRCGTCEVAPAYWEYLGYCDHPYDTTSIAVHSQGDRPPPNE